MKDWDIDGIVIGTDTSCRAADAGRMERSRLLEEHIDVPILSLEFDKVDARSYSDAMIKGQLETFMEVVDSAKKRKEEQAK